jgi:multicomponent Na+:H+ antiporter subunit C
MTNNFNYILIIIIFCSALYMIICSKNYLKKLLFLNIFQSSVLWFYISIGKKANAVPPILKCLSNTPCEYKYSNPLPQTLMLTAIVVGVTLFALGIKLINSMQDEN